MRRSVVATLSVSCALIAATRPGAGGQPAAPVAADRASRAAQLARVEQVYLSHREAGAPGAAPRAEDLLPRVHRAVAIEALLETRWGVRVTDAMLQAELDRVVRESRRPAVLRELLEACGGDVNVLADVVLRPELALRLAARRYEDTFGPRAQARLEHDVAAATAPAELPRAAGLSWPAAPADRAPGSPADAGCRHGGWSGGGLLEGPASAAGVAWTGSALLVVDGYGGPWTYDPSTDAWRLGSTLRGPDPLREAVVAWTGSSAIVLAADARSNRTYQRGAARILGGYAPGSDSWTPVVNPTTARGVRGIWSGAEGFTYGGAGWWFPTPVSCGAQSVTNQGLKRFDPVTATWSAGPDAPVARRFEHTAVWAGDAQGHGVMLVWGGSSIDYGPQTLLRDGAAFDPVPGTWRVLSAVNAPTARRQHVAVWTGSDMLVWGGRATDASTWFTDGGRYTVASDSWTPISSVQAPSGRSQSGALWTGERMLVWGGIGADGLPRADGAAYDPATDTWAALPPVSSPGGAVVGAAWSGTDAYFVLETGDVVRYRPAANSWIPVRSARDNMIPPRRNAQQVFTGLDLLVWSGLEATTSGWRSDGYRFDLALAAWIPLSSAGAPAPRDGAIVAWSGRSMIVLYGNDAGGWGATAGGRYDLATDSWSAVSRQGEPGLPATAAGAWDGSAVFVWFNGGARYRPDTDTWTPVSSAGAPVLYAYRPLALAMGSRVLVWGLSSAEPRVSIGAKYDPASDAWQAVAPAGVSWPSADGVWNGSRAYLWSAPDGAPDGVPERILDYDPAADAWHGASKGGHDGEAGSVAWDGTGVICSGALQHRVVQTDGPMTCDAFRDPNVVRTRWDPALGQREPLDNLVFPIGRTYAAGDAVLVVADTSNYGLFYDPRHTSNPDADGDGFAACFDCNDGDASIRPGAPELCDGKPNDCLSVSDWSQPTWRYSTTPDNEIDSDHDGYAGCQGDCAPYDASVHPGAPEICDYKDNNCDGTIDEGVRTTYYLDGDADGYGTSTTSSGCATTAPAGWALRAGDCNDGNAAIHPGALELCNGLDDDCDGTADDDVDGAPYPAHDLRLGPSRSAVTWTAQSASRNYDLVRGDLVALLTLHGNFKTSLSACLKNDTTATSATDTFTPAAGGGAYYLYRLRTCQLAVGTYDDVVGGQQGSRDAGIAGSSKACP